MAPSTHTLFTVDLDQPTSCELCQPVRVVDCEFADEDGPIRHSGRDVESEGGDQSVESEDSEQEV